MKKGVLVVLMIVFVLIAGYIATMMRGENKENIFLEDNQAEVSFASEEKNGACSAGLETVTKTTAVEITTEENIPTYSQHDEKEDETQPEFNSAQNETPLT